MIQHQSEGLASKLAGGRLQAFASFVVDGAEEYQGYVQIFRPHWFAPLRGMAPPKLGQGGANPFIRPQGKKQSLSHVSPGRSSCPATT